MTRWALLYSACFLQALGLFLMYLGKHFSLARPGATPALRSTRRCGRLCFAAGALALAAFAMLDSDLLLLAGQGVLLLLCLAGTPARPAKTPGKGAV